ncbi:MAG: CHASE4 domain-containing protein [Desulfobacterales bacterium]
MQTRYPEYIASNLVFSTFTGNQLNLIYIWDTQGSLIWGKTYDLTEKRNSGKPLFRQCPGTRSSVIRRQWKRQQHSTGHHGHMGHPGRPLLVSAAPILTSNGKGPSRGTLIMGRFLDAAAVAQIADQTQVNFSMAPAERPPGISFPPGTHPAVLPHAF